MSPDAEITALLENWDQRDDAEDRLFAAAYDELRGVAASLLASERAGHTLQPTALVNEAFLRLVDQARIGWEGRAHFFGTAARAMRQVLVDHARRKTAGKRGGADARRVTLHDEILGAEAIEFEILALEEALEQLHHLDERMRRIVEMKVFGGLTAQEIAHVLQVSKRTVDGEWAFARRWLTDRLS